MAKRRMLMFSYEEPQEMTVYEKEDYQVGLDNLKYFSQDVEEDEDSDIINTIIIEEAQLLQLEMDKNERWKTRLFREYFFNMIKLAA